MQVSIPFGSHDNSPISISFLASHGNDKFLLDTVLDMYSSLQELVGTISSSSLLVYTNGNNIDAAEVLKEKVRSPDYLRLLFYIYNISIFLFDYVIWVLFPMQNALYRGILPINVSSGIRLQITTQRR